MSYLSVSNLTTSKIATVDGSNPTASLSVSANAMIRVFGMWYNADYSPAVNAQVYIEGLNVWLNPTDVSGVFQSGAITVTSGMVGLQLRAQIFTYEGIEYSGVITLVSGEVLSKVTFSVNNDSYGSTIPSGEQWYVLPHLVQIQAIPKANCIFLRWEFNGTPQPLEATDIISASPDAVWVAVFAQIVYTLTIIKEGNGSGSVSTTIGGWNTTGPYASGDVVTLQAYPDSDSVFSGWNGTNNNFMNPTTVTMNGNKAVTALFSIQSSGDGYTVQWEGDIPPFKDGSYKWGLTFNITPIPFLDNYIVDLLSQRPQDETALNNALASNGITGTVAITNKEITKHTNALGNVDQFTITYTFTLTGTGLSLEGEQALVLWIPILVAAIPLILSLLTAVVYLLIVNSIVAGLTVVAGPGGSNIGILVAGGIGIAGLMFLTEREKSKKS